MGCTQRVYKGAINNLTIYTHAAGAEQIPSDGRVLHQTQPYSGRAAIGISSAALNSISGRFIRQLAILHTVASSSMSIRCGLLTMESRNDLFRQLDLDITRIGAQPLHQHGTASISPMDREAQAASK